MQISISLATLSRVGSTELSFRRGNRLPVEVIFLSGGDAEELPSGAVGKLALKSTPDGAYLALSDSWYKSGIGSSSVYVFDLNLNTQELAAALATANSIRALLEIEWVVGEYRYSSNAIPVVVQESLSQSQSDSPVEVETKASQQEAETGAANNKWMTPLRTFQAISAWIEANPDSFGILPPNWTGISGITRDANGNVTGLTAAYSTGVIITLAMTYGQVISGKYPLTSVSNGSKTQTFTYDASGLLTGVSVA